MVELSFCCEIYRYEIYGRLYEIYGSLRDLWEFRDLWGVQEACIPGQRIQNIHIYHMGKYEVYRLYSWPPRPPFITMFVYVTRCMYTQNVCVAQDSDVHRNRTQHP